jgi:hypothetical protein
MTVRATAKRRRRESRLDKRFKPTEEHPPGVKNTRLGKEPEEIAATTRSTIYQSFSVTSPILILVKQRLGSARLMLGLRRLPPVIQPLPAQRAAYGLKVIDDLGHCQSSALSTFSARMLPPQNGARAVMWVTPRQSVTALQQAHRFDVEFPHCFQCLQTPFWGAYMSFRCMLLLPKTI